MFSFSPVIASDASVALIQVFSTLIIVIPLVAAVAMIAGMWRIFTKAGKPGWASIIPIYNYIVLLEIVDRPKWWIVWMMFVPVANLAAFAVLATRLAESFDKSDDFAIGLMALPPVFIPMLGFDNSVYSR